MPDERYEQLMEHARDLVARQDWQQALAVFEEMVALKPDDARAHYNKASALHLLNRPGEACGAAARALELRPEYQAARDLLAELEAAITAQRQVQETPAEQAPQADQTTESKAQQGAEWLLTPASQSGPTSVPTAPQLGSAPAEDASAEWILLPPPVAPEEPEAVARPATGPVQEPGPAGTQQPTSAWVLTPTSPPDVTRSPEPPTLQPQRSGEWVLSPVSEGARDGVGSVAHEPVAAPSTSPATHQTGGHSGDQARSTAAPPMDRGLLSEYMRQNLQMHASAILHVAPHIPGNRLEGAMAAYAGQRPGEQVIALFDDTVVGNGRSGFLLTDQRLAWKPSFSSEVDSINLDDLEAATANGKRVILRTGGVDRSLEMVLIGADDAAAVAAVLQNVAGRLPGQAAAGAQPGMTVPPAAVKEGGRPGASMVAPETAVEGPLQRYLRHHNLAPKVLKSLTGMFGAGRPVKVVVAQGGLRLEVADGEWVFLSAASPPQVLNLDLSGLIVWKGLFKAGPDRQAGCVGCLLAPFYLVLLLLTSGLQLLSRVVPLPRGRVTLFAFVEGEPVDLTPPQGLDRIWAIYWLRHGLRERRARQQRVVHLVNVNPPANEHFREIVERALGVRVTVVDDALASRTIMFRNY